MQLNKYTSSTVPIHIQMKYAFPHTLKCTVVVVVVVLGKVLPTWEEKVGATNIYTQISILLGRQYNFVSSEGLNIRGSLWYVSHA